MEQQKVYYRLRKSFTFVPVLKHVNPVHVLRPDLFNIRFSIILSCLHLQTGRETHRALWLLSRVTFVAIATTADAVLFPGSLNCVLYVYQHKVFSGM